jgi:hypothetical protein
MTPRWGFIGKGIESFWPISSAKSIDAKMIKFLHKFRKPTPRPQRATTPKDFLPTSQTAQYRNIVRQSGFPISSLMKIVSSP